jgi:hypothetical protein
MAVRPLRGFPGLTVLIAVAPVLGCGVKFTLVLGHIGLLVVAARLVGSATCSTWFTAHARLPSPGTALYSAGSCHHHRGNTVAIPPEVRDLKGREPACRPGSVTPLSVTWQHSPEMLAGLAFYLSRLLISSCVFSRSGRFQAERGRFSRPATRPRHRGLAHFTVPARPNGELVRMTDTDPSGPPPPEDLTTRVFRALYPGYDLHDLAGTYLALPKGTPCFTAPILGEIARQISSREHRVADPPDALHHPRLPRRP